MEDEFEFELQINLGFAAPPFIEQLSIAGVTDNEACSRLDDQLKAMCLLYITGLITPSERGKADKRFMKLVNTLIDNAIKAGK